MLRRAVPLALLGLAVLAGCAGSGGGGHGLRVVATTTQLGDMVRAVGGDRISVDQLLRPNSDPHTYEPVPSDALSIADARIVFRSGGDVDGWLAQLIDSAGGDARVVDVSRAVRRRGRDPHWWQDPRNGERAVRQIRDALSAADPAGREGFIRRAAAYERHLQNLDVGIGVCLREVPARRRTLVTSHDALGYFAARYRIRVVGALIPSLSTEAQPSARQIQRLVDQIRAQHVRAIFPESSLNPKLERAVSREAGARVGDPLWADTLGPRGSSGATYLGSLAANTSALVKGMTGGYVTCRPHY